MADTTGRVALNYKELKAMEWYRDDKTNAIPLVAVGPASTDDLKAGLRRLGLRAIAANLRRIADGLLALEPGHGEDAGLLRIVAKRLTENGGGK